MTTTRTEEQGIIYLKQSSFTINVAISRTTTLKSKFYQSNSLKFLFLDDKPTLREKIKETVLLCVLNVILPSLDVYSDLAIIVVFYTGSRENPFCQDFVETFQEQDWLLEKNVSINFCSLFVCWNSITMKVTSAKAFFRVTHQVSFLKPQVIQ